MATGTNGIITLSELNAHYTSTQFENGFSGVSSNQCLTAGKIRSALKTPNYSWTYSSTYSNDDQLVQTQHLWNGTTDYVKYNKYTNPVRLWIKTNTGGASAVSVMLMASVSGAYSDYFDWGGDNGEMYSINVPSISTSYQYLGPWYAWGGSGAVLNQTMSTYVMVTIPSLSMYSAQSSTKTITISDFTHTLVFDVTVNITSKTVSHNVNWQ